MRIARFVALVMLAAIELHTVPASAQGLMLTPEKGFPKIAFPDSLVTPNNHCPVTGHQLNADVHPVYVNGVPIGFC
jgi:hypothetical protein